MSKSDAAGTRVRVSVPFLNIRVKPESDALVCGRLERGAVESITERVQENGKQWGKIKSRKRNAAEWIMLDFTENC